jgi:mono/diheme cytochrome c family protein
MRQFLLAAAILFTAAPLPAEAASLAGDAAAVEHGGGLAKENCAACHSVELEGKSPNTAAPPFRELGTRFPVETIDEALLAKIRPKHPDMPAFTMTRGQASDIAAYIAWLQPVEHGRRLVAENCATCHAVGKTGESPHLAAPPFRELWRLYPIETLEEAFVEGIETGHPDMPAFEASPTQITDILAYIRSVQDEK